LKKIAISYYKDYYHLSLNAVRSFKYCNPDYDIAVIKLNLGHIPVERPLFIIDQFLKGYNKVVCLGADTFTISNCNEFETNEYDILTSMSIHDSNSGCELELPRNRILRSNFNKFNYTNSDVLCCNNIEWMIDFWYLNKKDELRMGYWDQDYYCWLVNSDLYKSKIIDLSHVCYNESGRYQWLNGQLRKENDDIILNDNRILKIMHWAGAVLGQNKTQYHNNNWYLETLHSPLKDICIDIFKKSKDIEVPILEPDFRQIENKIKEVYL
jgi:hypothetical protein